MQYLDFEGLSRFNDGIKNILKNKVDIIEGKQLSTNDFTDEYKTKLDELTNNVSDTDDKFYEAVDLGLPSGTLWCKTNLGSETPENAGLYFAWGETTGYTEEQITNNERIFDILTYKFYDTINNDSVHHYFTKYNTTDNLTTLLPADDAAKFYINDKWSIPSDIQCKELIDYTTQTVISDYNNTGITGMLFTSKSNANSIFIPFGGVSSSDYGNGIIGSNTTGAIWASTLYYDTDLDKGYNTSNSDQLLITDTNELIITGLTGRTAGCNIRPVKMQELDTEGIVGIDIPTTNNLNIGTITDLNVQQYNLDTNIGVDNIDDYLVNPEYWARGNYVNIANVQNIDSITSLSFNYKNKTYLIPLAGYIFGLSIIEGEIYHINGIADYGDTEFYVKLMFTKLISQNKNGYDNYTLTFNEEYSNNGEIYKCNYPLMESTLYACFNMQNMDPILISNIIIKYKEKDNITYTLLSKQIGCIGQSYPIIFVKNTTGELYKFKFVTNEDNEYILEISPLIDITPITDEQIDEICQ